MICPNCGRQLDPVLEKICPGCGLNLYAGTDRDPVRSAPSSPGQHSAPEQKTTWSDRPLSFVPFTPGVTPEEPEETTPLFTQTMILLVSFAGGVLLLMILGCLFLQAQDQIVEVYVLFSAVAAALFFLTIRMGLKNAATNARKTLFHQGMLAAALIVLLSGLFIPTMLSVFYLFPGLMALGFAGWCLTDILKVPKLRRSKELEQLLITTIVVGGLAVLLPAAKFIFYLMNLIRSFTDLFNPRRWIQEAFDYLIQNM